MLTSPSLGTGVDINQYHFDLVFGVFHAVSQTATECAQQLYRYRPIVPIHIWVAPRPPFGYRDTNASKIKERILQTNEMTAFLIRIDRKTGKRGAEKDWALEAYCQILANRNQSINNLREDLRSLLLQMGNRIVLVGSDDDEGAIANLKNAAQALDSAYYSSVAKANNITASEYRARQSKDYLTPEEVFECEKYRIFSAYGMEVTPGLVEVDRGGRLIGAIASLEAILSDPGNPIIDEAGRSIPTPPAFVTDSDRGERQKLSLCIDWSNYSARWLARFNLGLHHVLKHLVDGGEVTATDPDLLNMTAIAVKCAAHIKAILGFTVPSDCEPIWLLATLVEQLGLKLSCRKQGPRGEQVKFYSLSVEELSFALAVIAHRQNKREQKAQTQPQLELKVNTSPVSTPPHNCIAISLVEGEDTGEAGGQGAGRKGEEETLGQGNRLLGEWHFAPNEENSSSPLHPASFPPAPRPLPPASSFVQMLRDSISCGVDAIKNVLKRWTSDLRWETVLELEAIAVEQLQQLEQVVPEFYSLLSEEVLPTQT